MDDRPYPSRWTPEAVEALWREHRGWVAALLYAHMPSPQGHADIHDLLQEVALSLVAHIDRLSSPEKIGPWLRTVAMNVARDAGRRRRVRRNTLSAGDQLDGLPARTTFHRETAGGDAAERGRTALKLVHGLPPDYREPLILNVRGLSCRQVAAVMELPLSTVETRIFRARAMVRAEMQALESAECERDAGVTPRTRAKPHAAGNEQRS